MFRPAPWFLLVFGLAGVLLARESRQPTGSLAGVDRAFLDWLSVNARPAGAAARAVREAPPVTLVEIDDSVFETPGRWPLVPLEYAEFLQTVQRYDPAVVAIEPVLNWNHAAPGTEQILLDQALTVPRLLLSMELGSDPPAAPRDAAPTLPAIGEVSGRTAALPDYPEIAAAPDGRLQLVAAASGMIVASAVNAGPVRDVPLLFRCHGRVVPAFTLQALTLALRLAPAEVTAVPGGNVQLGDRLTLPIDRAGRALLDSRTFGRVNRITLDDLTLLAADQGTPDTRAAAERMRGGVVVLGRTDRQARTLQTTDGRPLAPAEVLAWAVASLERDPPLRRASTTWEGAIIVGFALAGWLTLRLRRVAALAVTAGALAAYALAALSFFETSRLWLPAALPAGLTLLNALLPWLLLPARAPAAPAALPPPTPS